MPLFLKGSVVQSEVEAGGDDVMQRWWRGGVESCGRINGIVMLFVGRCEISLGDFMLFLSA